MIVRIAIVIGIWQGLNLLFESYWVPPPFGVVSRLMTDIGNGDMVRHVLYTSSEAVLGLVLGTVPALAIAFLLRRCPHVTAILEPFMAAGYGMPKLALTPLLLVWFGIGMGSTVALVALSAFFILYFNGVAGVRAVDPQLTRMATILGATERQVSRHLVLPAAAPFIVAGVRIALPYSVGSAVVAELISANRGLGYVIQFSATAFDTTGVFAALMAIALLVFAANAVVDRLESRLIRWRTMTARHGELNAVP